MRPWVQEVSGKHMVQGLAVLGFPLQVTLLCLQGFAGACKADADSEVLQSRVLSLVLWAVALLGGMAGSLNGGAGVPWGPGTQHPFQQDPEQWQWDAAVESLSHGLQGGLWSREW